jgi:hypothetical protein
VDPEIRHSQIDFEQFSQFMPVQRQPSWHRICTFLRLLQLLFPWQVQQQELGPFHNQPS